MAGTSFLGGLLGSNYQSKVERSQADWEDWVHKQVGELGLRYPEAGRNVQEHFKTYPTLDSFALGNPIAKGIGNLGSEIGEQYKQLWDDSQIRRLLEHFNVAPTLDRSSSTGLVKKKKKKKKRTQPR